MRFERKILTIFSILAVILVAGYLFIQLQTYPVKAVEEEEIEEETLTVTGIGFAKSMPSIVKIRFSVVTEDISVEDAVRRNAEKMCNAIEALSNLGIAKDEIRTSAYSITPVYKYNHDKVSTLVGYRVTNTIMVTTEKLNLTGKIIDKAIEAGLNKVDYVTFTVSDEELSMLKLEALKKAVKDAEVKSKVVADELNVQIVKVKTVNLDFYPSKPSFDIKMIGGEYVETPVLPGEVTVTAYVRIVYILSS